MKLTITLSMLLLAPALLPGQQFTQASESDPAAKTVLEKMRARYEAMKTLEARFTLEVEIPERPVDRQPGTLVQQGDKYRLVLPDRILASDGKAVRLFLPDKKEIQVNDAEPATGGGISSPGDLLKAYEWKDYVYALSQSFQENGVTVQQIEFKPVSRDTDFSKVRLTFNSKTLDILRIKSFGKDGSRFSVILHQITPKQEVPPSTFTISEKDCPDCHVEDLRLD
ncbi:MAG: hypothetical protein RLY31_2947 [Bacteroidota bacterium]|jgi:outer membrane lipoprotein-sorting protein